MGTDPQLLIYKNYLKMGNEDEENDNCFDGPFLNMNCVSENCCGLGNSIMVIIGGILVWCYISLARSAMIKYKKKYWTKPEPEKEPEPDKYQQGYDAGYDAGLQKAQAQGDGYGYETDPNQAYEADPGYYYDTDNNY